MTSPMTITELSIFNSEVLILPKLPKDQKIYFCKASLLPKNIKIFTIAAVKLPNINPKIKREVLLFILIDAKRITLNTPKLPKLAAIMIANRNPNSPEANQLPKTELPMISKATPRLAPELIPRT